MARIWHPAFVRIRLQLLLLAVLMVIATPSLAEMLIQPGDTLAVTIAEAPKLSGERKVDMEGRINLPQIGGLDVAGIGLAAAQEKLAQELVRRDILRSPTVLVEIAKYRPLYVGGKVRRPGAIDYEPGLTVRHALILAGGAGAAEDRSDSVDVPDLRAKWTSASYQLLQVDSRIARLRSELARSGDDKIDVPAGSVSKREAESLVSLDRNILKDRLKTWTASQTHLSDEISLFDLEIDVLGQLGALQEQERSLVGAQVDAAQTLVDKGLMPLPRLQELQRLQSESAQDLLQNRAFAARARQSRMNAEYDLTTSDTKWRLEVGQQLREALIDRSRVKADIDALSARILNAGADLSEASELALQMVVVIHRQAAGRETAIEAQMSTPVRPGDILDVSFAKGSG